MCGKVGNTSKHFETGSALVDEVDLVEKDAFDLQRAGLEGVDRLLHAGDSCMNRLLQDRNIRPWKIWTNEIR